MNTWRLLMVANRSVSPLPDVNPPLSRHYPAGIQPPSIRRAHRIFVRRDTTWRRPHAFFKSPFTTPKGLSCYERAPSHHRMTLLSHLRAPHATWGAQLSQQTALSTAQEALDGLLDRLRPSIGPFRPPPTIVRPCLPLAEGGGGGVRRPLSNSRMADCRETSDAEFESSQWDALIYLHKLSTWGHVSGQSQVKGQNRAPSGYGP